MSDWPIDYDRIIEERKQRNRPDDRNAAIAQAAIELIEHGPNTGYTYAEFMVYVERLADTIRSA